MGLHTLRGNPDGRVGDNRHRLELFTGLLAAGAGKPRFFLYALRPGAEIGLNSERTPSTGPTTTSADQITSHIQNPVGTTRSEA